MYSSVSGMSESVRVNRHSEQLSKLLEFCPSSLLLSENQRFLGYDCLSPKHRFLLFSLPPLLLHPALSPGKFLSSGQKVLMYTPVGSICFPNVTGQKCSTGPLMKAEQELFIQHPLETVTSKSSISSSKVSLP